MPTDPRMERLNDEQIEILFRYWAEYDEDAIRRAWRERAAQPKFAMEELIALGYTEEEAEDIKRAFET